LNQLIASIKSLCEKSASRPSLIEVNAFCDLMPGVFWRGLETYAAELLAMECWKESRLGEYDL
jgi:hypothetical protein